MKFVMIVNVPDTSDLADNDIEYLAHFLNDVLEYHVDASGITVRPLSEELSC